MPQGTSVVLSDTWPGLSCFAGSVFTAVDLSQERKSCRADRHKEKGAKLLWFLFVFPPTPLTSLACRHGCVCVHTSRPVYWWVQNNSVILWVGRGPGSWACCKNSIWEGKKLLKGVLRRPDNIKLLIKNQNSSWKSNKMDNNLQLEL